MMTRTILIPLLTISSVGAASAGATHGMVASVHPAATEAGVRVLKQGVMNNEMDDFSIQPGVKNYFGLVGGQANAMSRGEQRRTVCEQTRTSVRAKANTSSPAGLEEA